MSIDSIKLGVAPGDKTAIEITTLSAGGHDVGYRGVLAAGKQYQAKFTLIFSPADGSGDVKDEVFGVGGTEPLYGGKTREEVDGDGQKHYPDPGTGPNPGYKLCDLEGVSFGGESWIWDLSFRSMVNFKGCKDGLLTVQGSLGDLKTQSEVLQISKGRCTGKL